MSRNIVGFDETDILANLDFDDMDSERQTIHHFVMDDSGSLWQYEDLVRMCFEDHKQSLLDSDVCDETVVAKTTFSSTISIGKGYTQVKDLDTSYNAIGSRTRLYDAICEVAEHLNYMLEEMLDRHYRSRAVVILMTDGQDNASKSGSFTKAKEHIKNLYQKEVIIYFIEFGSEAKGVAKRLGIKNEHILSPGNPGDSPEERQRALRRALNYASKSAISISKGGVAPNVSSNGAFAI